MKSVTFKEWNLDKLDQLFNLKQIWQSKLLARWQNKTEEIEAFKKRTLTYLQKLFFSSGSAS